MYSLLAISCAGFCLVLVFILVGMWIRSKDRKDNHEQNFAVPYMHKGRER